MSILDFFRRAGSVDVQNLPDDESGEKAGKYDALKINTVWACVNIISNAVASLPLDLYRRTENGREKATDHRLYKLTKYPSLDMPAYNYMESLLVNLLVYGNAYVELVKTRGQIRELHLIPSNRISVSDADGQVKYNYLDDDGVVSGTFEDGQIMPIVGKCFNGHNGLSPVEMGLKSIGLARALEAFGLSYFERGARPSGFLSTSRKLSDQAVARLKRAFADQYMGSKNSGKMIILEDGLKYDQAQNGNDSSQFLESRRFAVEEISRLFAVPLYMLGDTSKTTSWGAGIESMGISFVTYCLQPFLSRIEEAYSFYLLSDRPQSGGLSERDLYYFEFNVAGLLRGDQKSRYEAYHTALMDGWLSPNEVRAKENLPAVENGDTYFIPVNMAPYAGADRDQVRGDEDDNNDREI